MTTFGLVHGAYHGGWCWDRLVPELASRGFDTVAPDLPCDDVSAGLDDYASVVVDALQGHDDVVLVGHSLGSLTIPVVAARRPIRHMVFLCSVPTGPGATVGEAMGEMVRPGFMAAPRFSDGTDRDLLTATDARQLFFHDCTDADAWWAVANLRPQAHKPMAERSPLTEWPDATSSVVLTDDDQAVEPRWAIPAARAFVGKDPTVLPGSHSPFLSRPAQLAEVLATLAAS
jgi:pimeloyl-ACP methyl ester carboxylesterase